MPQQLIINILGAASLNSLCTLTACISNHDCNILDSRHALYGTDFSLTMIVSGTTNDVTRLEMGMSNVCMEHDLLCMMKRTSGHQKQNIERYIQLTFSGQDSSGLMQKVTSTLATSGLTVSAVRHKTSYQAVDDKATLRKRPPVQNVVCKMILSAPKQLDLSAFDATIKSLLHTLGLHGQISHNIQKENHEHIESW